MKERPLQHRIFGLVGCLVLLSLAGCRRPALTPTLGGRTDFVSLAQAQSEGLQPVVLSLVVNAFVTNDHGKLSERSIAPGEALHSGDLFSLLVEVDRPAYVYVMQGVTSGPAAGSVQLLYPRAGEYRIEPGALRRIPQAGMFALDQQPGGRILREDLFVTAAVRPLATSVLHEGLTRRLGEYDRTPQSKRDLGSDKSMLRKLAAPRPARLEEGPGMLDRDKPFPGAKGVVYTEIETQVDRSTRATILHFPFLHIGSGWRNR